MAHLDVALSENGVQALFAGVVDNFSFAAQDDRDLGRITVGYDIELHLEGGAVDFTNAGTLRIRELDIKWDKAEVSLGLDIPSVCVGGGCVRILGKRFCLPEWCIFEADPDISLSPDLATLITTSEISGEVRPYTTYFVNPERPANMDYLMRQVTMDSNGNAMVDQWRVHLDPVWLDVDPIDFADSVGDLIENAINSFVNGLLGGFPGWVRDLILAITGPIVSFIRNALDLVDDFDEWLSDIFNFSFGLGDLILTVVGDFLRDRFPILKYENPVPIMGATGSLNPVKIPLEAFAITVNTDEMIVSADVGVNMP